MTNFSEKSFLNDAEFKKNTKELESRIIHKTKTEGWKKYRDTNYYVAKSGAIIYSETPINSDDSIGYENYYKCLDWIMTNDGPAVKFYGKGQLLPVHKIVAETFKPIDCQEKYEVHHIDGNSYNNSIENLIWLLKTNHRSLPK